MEDNTRRQKLTSEWKKRNPAIVKDSNSLYYKNNKSKIRSKYKEWFQANKEKNRLSGVSP